MVFAKHHTVHKGLQHLLPPPLTSVIFSWMNYLFEKRNEHYHLNHFNIHQLTYLCKKLSRVEGNDFPDQVYQLLAGIASNLNYGNITDCLEEVTKINDEPEQADGALMQGKQCF